MATQISKNNSHRRLIKEKTNQLVDFRRQTPKSTLNIRSVPITNAPENKQYHLHQDSFNTSIDGRLKVDSPLKQDATGKHTFFIRKRNGSSSRPKTDGTKFKSVEAASSRRAKSPGLRPSFSVRKMNVQTARRQISSMENLESQLSPQKKQPIDYLKPRSENYLRQTLKKTSSKQLKLKVKDPFEKRRKLDNQFADASIIQRNYDDESLMLSTVNQEEFKELLSKIL